MTSERLYLSVGTSGAQRVLFTVFGLVFGAFSLAFVFFADIVGVLNGWMFGDTFSGFGDDTGFGGFGGDPGFGGYDGELPSELQDSGSGWSLDPFRIVGLVCGLPFVAVGVLIVASALRRAAWLEGSRVFVRGAILTRSVDLSTADVSAGALTYRGEDSLGRDTVQRIPAILAEDPVTRRRVEVPLRGAGLDLLPPRELRALADALAAGRRSEIEETRAQKLAEHLRKLADDPLAV